MPECQLRGQEHLPICAMIFLRDHHIAYDHIVGSHRIYVILLKAEELARLPDAVQKRNEKG